jgi:hypothetical protein
MIGVYVFFLLFQLLNTYLGILAPLNPYIFSVLFIVYGFKDSVKITNLKILTTLLVFSICLIIIYAVKFSILSSLPTTAKAVQFNFGYYILIPGFTVLFKLFPKVTIEDILRVTFWTISSELFLEFILIRILYVSPGAFQHYPKLQHITYDPVTGEYTANRLLGMAGNASVTGVIYTSSFILYLGALYKKAKTLKARKSLIVICTFIACFFMIVSGSAFFAIILTAFIVWSQKEGNLLKNLFIAVFIVMVILFIFNYLSSLTDIFSNKFTTEYLVFLLTNGDEGSLPYILNDMSKGYHWYNLLLGSYFFEWGNPDAVIKTVDYFYVNLIYEFGLVGLTIFFYIIKTAYNVIKKNTVLDNQYLKFGFLVLVVGSLHYPSIVYMAAQIFISALAAIAIRDNVPACQPNTSNIPRVKQTE